MSKSKGQNWRTERCDVCDVGFGTKENLWEHYQTQKHKQKQNRDMLSDLLNVPGEGHVVYCIKISPLTQNREYYYVGRTMNFYNRMRQHKQIGPPKKRFPTKDGKETSVEVYEFVEFVGAEVCDSKDHAIVREREKAFEVAQKENTVDVLGAQ